MLKNIFLRRRARDFYRYFNKGKHVVSVTITNKNITATLHDESGRAILGSTTIGKKLHSNIEGASAVGRDLSKKIIDFGVQDVVFNKSGFKFHGKVAKIVEELRASGLKI